MKSPYLKVPRVEVFKGRQGRFEGIHVSLQRAGLKATCGVTPNPDVMIDIAVDREGRPVFFSFLETVDVPTLVRTVRMFLAGYEGMLGAGPPRRLRPGIADPQAVEALLRGVERVVPHLAAWSVSQRPPRRALSA